MVNRLVLAILIFATYTASAQTGTVSPYSALGVGDFRNIRSVENEMMGGLGIYTDSIHLHMNNPAGLGKLGATVYTAALSHRELRVESNDDEQSTSVTNLDYLAIALPLKSQRGGIAFGIRPFSSVGYALVLETTFPDGTVITNESNGTGGINQAFLSVGFEILPRLHAGATANLHFGNLEYSRLEITDGVTFGTIDERVSNVSGFNFNYALTYMPKISDKHNLFLSGRANTQANLVSKNEQRIGTFVPLTGTTIEAVDVDLEAENLRQTEIKIPTTFSFGAGIGEDKHWFVGGEYSFQQFSEFKNPFLQEDNVIFEDANSMAFGGYYIPNYNSLTSYFNRITYRAGLRLDNTGFIVNDKPLENFGITFGLGLPLGVPGQGFSNLNLGFELGRRGTTMNNLIRESYFKLNIGLSFNSRWFLKRQIN
jgi:hypothetical protein